MAAETPPGALELAEDRAPASTLAASRAMLPVATGSRPSDRPVLIVGTGPRAARCARALRLAEPSRTIVGAVDAESRPELAAVTPPIPFLGTFEELPAVVRSRRVDEIVMALPLRSRAADCHRIWTTAERLRVRVRSDIGTPGHPAARRVMEGVGCDPQTPHAADRLPGRWLKRGIDLLGSGLALLLLLPLFAALCAGLWLGNPGPVMFRQLRIGRGGRPFLMFKFRTMVENAEALRAGLSGMNEGRGHAFKILRDPRVTRVGRFLRRTSLDELPQLLNVLRGEMSLVGPRPLPAWMVADLDDHISRLRHRLLPGMTGLWQVTSRRQDLDIMSRIDRDYVERWSIGLDLAILASTLPAVLRGEHAY